MACNGDCGSCAGLHLLPMPKNIYSPDEKSYPVQAIYSLTDNCNLRCPYCFSCRHENKTTFEIADSVAKFVIENSKKNNKRPGITFFGGEPLLMYDEIIKPLVLKYEDALEWSITTNGTLLTEEIIDFFYEHKVGLLLSMDGVKEVQDKQRPMVNGSSFDKLKDIIPYLLYRFPETTFRATVTKYSLDYLQETKDFIEKMGFKFYTLIPNFFEEWSEEDYKKWQYFLDSCGIELLGKIIDEEPLKAVPNMLTMAVNELIEYGEDPKLLPPAERCGMGHYGVGVSFDGKLHPCQEDNSTLDFIIGDIYDGVDIEKQKEYYDLLYSKFTEYIERINQMEVTNAFKLYLARGYCPTRLREGKADSTSALLSLKGLFLAASRLKETCEYSMHPMCKQLFGGEDNGNS